MSERGKRVADRKAAGRKDALLRSRKGWRWTKRAEDRFFAELALTANISHAAKQVGTSGQGAHARRRSNAAFAARWLEALDEGYAALEMLMLDQSLHGAERTETVRDAEGKVKQEKSVRSFPHAVAIRLLQSHRETVERYRGMAAQRIEDDPAAVARFHEELDRVQARLMADDRAMPGGAGQEQSAPGQSVQDQSVQAQPRHGQSAQRRAAPGQSVQDQSAQDRATQDRATHQEAADG
ncbi:hypothetical protein LWE61_19190 [Sphingobium sufflavum]|uniref:hypothetical protein n=1 Tax=Sphingobium sufflavum TaxID=1129547 RepID=UPI001F1826E5|nr:hypothetical protein [Sphingobium sufflavum]MCE7798661.1 hypothetical protein [Sphingobium sufflavum]